MESPGENSQGISKASLAHSLKKAGIRLDAKQLEALWKFHCHLRKRNPELNMTRIHSFDAIVRKHYIDSLLVLQILKEAGITLQGRMLDIGTGAGFPGIPLAIACPELHLILAEGRRQRTEFLEEVIQLLGLHNAEVFAGRVHSYQGQGADFVITRAVEPMKDSLRHAIGNTSPQAHFVFMKGPNCDSEIEDAKLLNRYELILDKSYCLPDSRDARRLVVWRPRPSLFLKSSDNKKRKLLKNLLHSRGIKKEGRCLVFGQKLVSEILGAQLQDRQGIPSKKGLSSKVDHSQAMKNDQDTTATGRPGKQVLLQKPSQKGNPERFHTVEAIISHPEQALPAYPEQIPLWDLPPAFFKEMDIFGTRHPFLLFRYEPPKKWEPGFYENGLAVVLPLQDPANLGAAIRSALAFGASCILLTKEAANPFHPKAIRASAGGVLFAPLFSASSIHALADEAFGEGTHLSQGRVPGPELLVLDKNGENLLNFSFPKNCVLILGEEGRGIPDSLAKGIRKLSIPLANNVESLNATVGLSVALYEYRRQIGLTAFGL